MLKDDAVAIWQAGVDAVDSARLVRQNVVADPDGLTICGRHWQASPDSRICVVGGGKAGAGMAAGLEASLGPAWLARTTGWVNVPADCLPATPLQSIHLHAARPAGVNEPTQAGADGTRKILDLVQSLSSDDLCLVLISGGGSALLPAPIDGVSLAEKRRVTQLLMRGGATIQDLNCVRRALSRFKGGGLLRACQAGRLIALIISDVIGDPLDVIASGPTVDGTPDPTLAIQVLKKYAQNDSDVPASIWEALARPVEAKSSVRLQAENLIIGNNRTAVAAAEKRAQAMGYPVALTEWDQPGVAAEFGREFADRLLALRKNSVPFSKLCLISGGEPTVTLAKTDKPQKGGRNQEVVLAAVARLLQDDSFMNEALHAPDIDDFAILSGGADGEDGPTDAAGAVADRSLLERVQSSQAEPEEFLAVNHSYAFFETYGGHLKTGPTHTNVMDLRIGLLQQKAPG